MPAGEGRAWSKGKTAATDPRVARNAERHRGRSYVRRTPVELCRWRLGQARSPVEWTPSLAYAVGLIVTDGCLIAGIRRIDFCSEDRQIIGTYLECLGREPHRFRIDRTALGSPIYRVRLKDAELYRWLTQIGLTPRKSLTLGALQVPEDQLRHVVRGLLDGDGTIFNKTSAADTTRRPDRTYQYEWLRVRFISASRDHMTWLQGRLRAALPVTGAITTSARAGRTTMFKLEFGRWDSMRLLKWMYSDSAAPCLLRKRAIWDQYVARHAPDVARA